MSSLDKQRQKQLFIWLRQQTKQDKMKLRLSVLTGFALACCIVIQAALLAVILQTLIIDNGDFSTILPYLIILAAFFGIRSLFVYWREQINFALGQAIRQKVRNQIIDKIESDGPTSIHRHTAGGLSTLLIEQVENLQDFYARYLPQMRLAMMIPTLILVVILPFNWAAALILFCTAPLIPIFMVLVGMGAADVNRKNFKALAYLSGHFLDRLKGLQTIRLFNQGNYQESQISDAAESFRAKTMSVLKMAFLSSAVLEFFTSVSIAVVAVYFGFSYLGELNFGSSVINSLSGNVTLFAGFFALILAPEFFQPLRDLGAFYHAKAQAVAAADNIETFLKSSDSQQNESVINRTNIDKIKFNQTIKTICANNFVVLSPDHQPLVGPLTFELNAPFRLALLGTSGEGKSSLLNALLGFLPYQGSLKINGIELNSLEINSWRNQLSWIGQNPYLLNTTIRQNILLGKPDANDDELKQAIKQAQLVSFIDNLPLGMDTQIGEDAVSVSVGQAQRIAIARALLKPCQLLLLDEPTASLDKQTAHEIEMILANNQQARQIIMVTHQLNDLIQFNQTWRLQNNQVTALHKEDLSSC